VAQTLRCHFITTTKLSKITRPTRCLNWRKHQLYLVSNSVSTGVARFLETFFRRTTFGNLADIRQVCRRISYRPVSCGELGLDYIGSCLLRNPCKIILSKWFRTCWYFMSYGDPQSCRSSFFSQRRCPPLGKTPCEGRTFRLLRTDLLAVLGAQQPDQSAIIL
jgi:hypothetical protein